MLCPSRALPAVRRLASSGRKTRAFTLIEILVVVAIMAILAVIAFPVAGGMLDRGADASDLNNLRQIGTAISQFAAENGGRIPNNVVPIAGAAAADGTPRSSFMESVDRFLPPDGKFNPNSIYNWQRRPIWYSQRFAKMPDGKSFIANSQHYWGIAWGMNSQLYYNSGSANMNNFKGYLMRAPNLSKLVLVGEKNRNGGHDFVPSQAPTFQKNVEAQYRVSRGGGGDSSRAYYLFADYHIESLVGDHSSIAHPEYNSYSPTNTLYYRW
jgi:prepilin-type N-terminal cleavage/methylation domain-containing protein